MSVEQRTAQNPIDRLEETIVQEDRRMLTQARWGIGIRIALIVFVAGYMTWLFSAVSKLDADSLTTMASATIEERLPEVRAKIRDYALEQAPMLTEVASRTLLEIPVRMREELQKMVLDEGTRMIGGLESDIDTAIGEVLEQQLALIGDETSTGTPEDHLDALILGISTEFRQTMTASLDFMYVEHASEVRRLNEQLIRLQKGEELTDSEELDKQLLEVWMTLVHKHGVTEPLQIVERLESQF